MRRVHRNGRRHERVRAVERLAVEHVLQRVESRTRGERILAREDAAVPQQIAEMAVGAGAVVYGGGSALCVLREDLSLQGNGSLDLVGLVQRVSLPADLELRRLHIRRRRNPFGDAECVEPEGADERAGEQTDDQGLYEALAGKGAERLADDHLRDEVADHRADERERKVRREEFPVSCAAVEAEAAEEEQHRKRNAEREEAGHNVFEDRLQHGDGRRLLRALVLPQHKECGTVVVSAVSDGEAVKLVNYLAVLLLCGLALKEVILHLALAVVHTSEHVEALLCPCTGSRTLCPDAHVLGNYALTVLEDLDIGGTLPFCALLVVVGL